MGRLGINILLRRTFLKKENERGYLFGKKRGRGGYMGRVLYFGRGLDGER